MIQRPRRSVLYMPASNARALEKAQSLKADSFIFDLEDAVAAENKDTARQQAVAAAGLDAYGGREVMIRSNGLGTPWIEDDIAAVARSAADAIAVPKIESAGDVHSVRSLLAHHDRADIAFFAMLETPLAFLQAREIAAEVGAGGGLVIGTNDLEKELGVAHVPDRSNIVTALQTAVLAGKAYGLAVIDGVYGNFGDAEGLAQECAQGREFGFDGKSLIHPNQIDTANAVFGPSGADIQDARAIVEAFEAARAKGLFVANMDGRMIEELHATQARAVIDYAARLEGLS